MTKIRLLILLTALSLCSFSSGHKFYVSVTEIEYNEDEKSLQIISRVFLDDFENVLRERYDQDLQLSEGAESERVKFYIDKYLQQKLEIIIDGEIVSFQYLGKEYENDMILLYIEAPKVEKFENIRIKNAVLMDLFEDQKNLVHVEFNGKTKSLVLADGRDEDELRF